MNIFVTDLDPVVAARNLCDKHVVKMIVETTQILSTVSHRHGGTFVPYKPTHGRHPCTLWAGDSFANWMWLADHGIALVTEYHMRYKKVHKCLELLIELKVRGEAGDGSPINGEFGEMSQLTPFAQAMPEQYKCADVVQAYRAYYIGEKARFAKWRYCDPPEWWPKSV